MIEHVLASEKKLTVIASFLLDSVSGGYAVGPLGVYITVWLIVTDSSRLFVLAICSIDLNCLTKGLTWPAVVMMGQSGLRR